MNTLHKLAAYAEDDDFEYVGHCMYLFFAIKGNEPSPTVETAHSVTEAHQIIRKRKKQGYRLCWKSFGPMYLPSGPINMEDRAA